MSYEFHKVSEYDFFTKVEDVKRHLEKVAPHWKVNVLPEPGRADDLPLRKFFTCAQAYFERHYPKIIFPESIFAYIEGDTYYLLSKQIEEILNIKD